MNKKARKIVFIIFLSFIASIIIFFGIAFIELFPKDSSNESNIVVEIPQGMNKSEIADKLKDADLIKNAFFLKVFLKISSPTLYAGTYTFSPSMSALEIIEKMKKQDNLENETVSITFIEGKRLTNYVNQIVENFDFTEEEVNETLSDSKFLNELINKYWFLSNDILNNEIYYPLEGYIFPDTYEFKKTSTVQDIVIKVLDNMSNKLEQYKEEIELSNYSIHELLTLASIVELEGTNSNDRAGIAGVFYNRLNNNWTLGSDVTAYYAAKKDFSSDLTYSEINSCNPYNTRGTCVKGLPIGPIASPSLSSIVAAIEPTNHDYYYFVSDINKETYYSKNAIEHEQIVAKLKSEGKWYEY